jgi:hypothetical protein
MENGNLSEQPLKFGFMRILLVLNLKKKILSFVLGLSDHVL